MAEDKIQVKKENSGKAGKEEIEIWVPSNTKEVKIKGLDITQEELKGAKKEAKPDRKKEEMVTVSKREDNISKDQLRNALDDERQKILQISEISLWLDTYDDIFSDFDPRPYAQRALSDDFLNETKKASKEKTSGELELKFLVPKSERSFEKEGTIKKRLREHFKKHYNMLHTDVVKIRKKGLTFVLLGAIITFVATYIITIELPNLDFLIKFLFVLMEPAGWFITWTGLEHIFSARKQKEADIDFYDKMAKCKILFVSY